MKVYCLMCSEDRADELVSVWKSWAEAYDKASQCMADEAWIGIFDLDTGNNVGNMHWVGKRIPRGPFTYRDEYSRDVDPSQEDDGVVWGHA